MNKTLKEHQNKVGLVQRQVAQAYKVNLKIMIKHGSTNSTRPQNISGLKVIDVSNLNSVIEVNTQKGYIVVEPNVPMDLLADSTIQKGFIAPIVTEFPGITVGGVSKTFLHLAISPLMRCKLFPTCCTNLIS